MRSSSNFRRLALAASAMAISAAFTVSAWSAAPPAGATVGGPPGPNSFAPLPKGNVADTVKEMGITESDKTAKDIVKRWRKPAKVLVRVDANPDRIKWLQEAAPGVKLVAIHNQQEAMAEVADADALVGFCGPEPLLAAGKNIRWMHASTAGVEECVGSPEIQNGQITLTNMQRIYGPTIAQHVMALLLGLTRGLDIYIRMDAAQHFERGPGVIPEGKLRDINGKTMLVVGLGGLGTDAAKLAHGMGMKIIATRNSSHEGPDFVDYVGLSDELPKLIGQADVVLLTAPLTKETTGMFNAAMFNRMKKGALFINVSRGGLVVGEDLAAALKSGQLGGAGLDTTVPEPLTDKHPLFSAPNIIITPHMAAAAADAGTQGEAVWLIMKENLRRYVAGEKLYSVVDPGRGY